MLTPDRLALKLYRISRWCYHHNLDILAKFFTGITLYTCSMYVHYKADIKENFKIHNGFGLGIGREVKAGRNFHVSQGVTVGVNWGQQKGDQIFPEIGDNVWIMAGTVVVGPIKIGDNVIIGANSFVNKDIPENSVVAGVPAKVIRQINENDLSILTRTT